MIVWKADRWEERVRYAAASVGEGRSAQGPRVAERGPLNDRASLPRDEERGRDTPSAARNGVLTGGTGSCHGYRRQLLRVNKGVLPLNIGEHRERRWEVTITHLDRTLREIMYVYAGTC